MKKRKEGQESLNEPSMPADGDVPTSDGLAVTADASEDQASEGDEEGVTAEWVPPSDGEGEGATPQAAHPGDGESGSGESGSDEPGSDVSEGVAASNGIALDADADEEITLADGRYVAGETTLSDSGDSSVGDAEGFVPTELEDVVASDGSGGESAVADDEAPLPADNARVESIVESLLFAADRPLTLLDFKRLLDEGDSDRVSQALATLRDRRKESGIQVVSVAGGWQLRTHPMNGNWVAKLVAGRPQRLSRALMETMAIVAYRQPITRPEIDEIRGVDCGPVLRTLLERGLVRVIGKKEEVGRPILYGTTPEFLKTFSMRDLTELPTLREFHELGAEDRAKVDSKLGPVPTVALPGDADALPMPTVSELPTYDESEEDALIDELESATEAAAVATRAQTDPTTENNDGNAAVSPDSSEV